MPVELERYREEHTRIYTLLREAKEASLGTREGLERLMSARDMLLSHLEGEDREFYPALRKAAEKDAQLVRALDVLEDDIKDVSRIAREFFARCCPEGGGLDFVREFGTFFIMFMERAAKEENVLFPEYERLAGQGETDPGKYAFRPF